MKNLLIVCMAIAFWGCSYEPPPPPAQDWQKIRIDDIDYPKHFRMSYTVLSTGEVRRAYSKHCSKSRDYEKHDVIVVDVNRTGCSIFDKE